MKVPAAPPDVKRLLSRHLGGRRQQRVERAVRGPMPEGRYLHWDHLRYRVPPDGLTHEEWWVGIKLARQARYRYLPLQDRGGREFVLALVPPLEDALVRVDEVARGFAPMERYGLLPREARVELLMEEALHSAQMEGAALGRMDALEMLRGGREPVGRNERMVADCYAALRLVEDLADEPLTPELVMELHQRMTARTLEHGAAGRLRQPHEEASVYTLRGEALFDPPPAQSLKGRLADLCAFASGETPDWPLHPVLRGLVVHLWVAWEHPFVDGNGRVARALFQWAMLSQGYPLLASLPLSRVLRREKGAYERALLYTMSDGCDATYFVLFLLETIAEALALEGPPLAAPEEEERAVAPVPVEEQPTERAARPPITLLEHAMKAGGALNERQLALVHRALRHPTEPITVQRHREEHGVAYETARHDLQDLYLRGLVTRRRAGRAWEFLPAPDLAARLMS